MSIMKSPAVIDAEMSLAVSPSLLLSQSASRLPAVFGQQERLMQFYFATASDALPESERPKLQRLADLLMAEPRLTVLFEGYADARGTDEYNNVLSFYRSVAVSDALAVLGVGAERMMVSGRGCPGTHAITGDHDQQRRVDVFIVRR